MKLAQNQADWYKSTFDQLVENVATVVLGKERVIELAFTTMLAGGHLLLEDAPGTGKTQLAKSMAATLKGTNNRIQFTPDLLPSDITGVNIYDRAESRFVFHPGPVFSNIVIGDEINRASPKTQSALLECMEEGQVTIDGTTHPLPRPFMVIATQNPFDMDGTFVLPDAQRDRFMARLEIGYPDADSELAMVRSRKVAAPIDSVQSVVSLSDFALQMRMAREVFEHEEVERYAVSLVRATRDLPSVRLGASPRSTLQLMRAAKARAHIEGRTWVSPDDIRVLAPAILSHRLVLRDLGASFDDAAVAVHQAIAETRPPVVRAH